MSAHDPSLLLRTTHHQSNAGCTMQTCPVSMSLYGYRPSLPVNYIFIVLFAILFIAHMWLGIRRRSWSFLVALGVGTLLEVIGYISRIELYHDLFKRSNLAVNILGLTVAPVFMAAGIYLTLKHLVIILGRKYSRFQPQWYTRVFITCDIFSFVVQTAGSALSTDMSLLSTADVLMETGISFQVFTLLVFGYLAWEFWTKYRKDTPSAVSSLTDDPKLKKALMAVVVAYITILIRCIYRIAEMAGGWKNIVMRNQVAFIVLDGVMVFIACLVLALWHPGEIFAKSKTSERGDDVHDVEVAVEESRVGTGTESGENILMKERHVGGMPEK